MQPNVARAIADLAARLNVGIESVEFILAVPDDFPASNLGCGEFSEEPERPIPAFVAGQRILLGVDGYCYVYHAHGVQVVYCGMAEG